MMSIWKNLLEIISVWQVATFLTGWAGSVGVTHTLKLAARRFKLMSADTLAAVSWAVAMLTAFVFAALYGLDTKGSTSAVLLVAVITAIWSPIAFTGLQRFLRASPEIGKRKGFGWVPDLSGVADWLSADQSGKKENGDAR